jgi:hypothetical protein
MKARLMLKTRRPIAANAFAEIIIWQLPQPSPGSAHEFKYRLAYVVEDVCVLRYDNESGKGDHRHYNAVETAYAFTTTKQLLADFWRDVANWRP